MSDVNRGPAWLSGPAWLFCPADRPQRYAKAFERADVVVLDLEDAVGPDRKEYARESLLAAELDPERTVVRINAAGTPDHRKDLDLLEKLGPIPVMLAKTERPDDLDALTRHEVFALIETPLGVERVGEVVARSNVAGAMWGADDLVAGLGGTGSRFNDGTYRDVARFARARTLIAAKAHGRLALDAVHMAIPDLEGLRTECEDAVASGFDATLAIHPSQVPIIRAAYAPSPEQVRWAQALLLEARDKNGVFTFEGRMVDGPIFRQAERIIAQQHAIARQ